MCFVSELHEVVFTFLLLKVGAIFVTLKVDMALELKGDNNPKLLEKLSHSITELNDI